MLILINKNLFFQIPSLMICTLIFGCMDTGKSDYSVAENPWPESLGNHRSVIEIPEKAEAVKLDLEWRRHDLTPGDKRFIIIEEATGDSIPNIYRKEVNNERCKIAFGPVKNPGKYFFYYLPIIVQPGSGFYNKGYQQKEVKPSSGWIEENHLGDPAKYEMLPEVKFKEFQSRTGFDSFYPMEVIALALEKKALTTLYNSDYLVFPEDRKYPIRMKDEIPERWIKKGPSSKFTGAAEKNEYYTFQLGLYAVKKDLENVKVSFSSFSNEGNVIPVSGLTCFNTGGIGPYGEPFDKRIDVAKNSIQPLWIGIDVPADIPAGTYLGSVTVQPENADPQKVEVSIKILDKVLADRGDNEPWRHSRLRWLNSRLGIDDRPVKPNEAIEREGGNTFKLSNKKVSFGIDELPGSIKAGVNEILSGPVSFIVESENRVEMFSRTDSTVIIKNEPGILSKSWKSSSGTLLLAGQNSMESDGYIHFNLKIKAVKDTRLKDIRLEIPFRKEVAEYMMGMGLPGTYVPPKHEAGWAGPHDSFWVGNAGAGIWCELRGPEYHGPLRNLYQTPFPASWYNQGHGGFRIEKRQHMTKAEVFSGSRKLNAGDSIEFEWSMLITPVKEINYQSQFVNRYFQNGQHPMPSEQDHATGVKIVNLHHANNYNPYINYPFIAVDSMKWFVDQLHAKGMKVKIYYTIRELSNYATEIWAFRSLGNEILGTGKGGGYPWLQEHLVDNYKPTWYHHFPDKSPDASIVNVPGETRWYNYYIEGLGWLVKNVGIDGLYLDDVMYDRRTLKRLRKVMDDIKPGCLLDLHSHRPSSGGPAIQYTEFFPYVDKLWFGESFEYNKMPPENWFVEVSGIPFGLMGDMLEGGGNPWRGMVYGMTVRYPWESLGKNCDPREIWKIWDSFEIDKAVMKGYWDESCPVKTDHPGILATVYIGWGKSLVSLASWAPEKQNAKLILDWKALGIDPENAKITAPAIEGFQPGRSFGIKDEIPVDPAQGWLLIIE